MEKFDDILNVYAYLFSKSAETADASRRLAEKASALDASFAELKEQADGMLSDMDELMAQAYALAEEWNVDTSDIPGRTDDALEDLPEPVSGKISADIRIPIPVNYNYAREFRQLVKEAHEAGFTRTYPEDLLTPEEMARAEAFSSQLDAEFCAATRLQPKDMTVLAIAVAARVLLYFISGKIRSVRREQKEREAAESQATPAEEITVSEGSAAYDVISAQPPHSQGTSAADTAPIKAGSVHTASVNAAQGVDISGMLNNMSNQGSAIKTGQNIVNKVTQKFGNPARILDHNTILEQNAPFDIQETDLFEKNDIVAYHKFLGWVVGTVNILTDTITTYGMKSYSITRPTPGTGKPCVNREISTVFGVLNPVVQSASFYKDSIAAAVVQEALTQGFGKASHQEVRTLFGRAMELENSTTAFAEETKGILGGFNAQWAACVGGIAGTALINTIVAAVHAMMYEESDGSLDTYSIRTSRIILYSGAIATTVNSLPAVASRNPADLDFSGILTTCMSWFQSNRFWIEAKTEFLVSAYKQKLDQELEKLDQYFQYQL